MSSAQPLALSKGDFDADGVEDLVVGYGTADGGLLAIHRGNLDAFAPQSDASFYAIAHGEFPSPFLPDAKLIELPVRPDFVVVGSYNGEGYPDIIVAQRDDSSVYLLGNNGKGVFSAPKQINVGGRITSLAAGDFGHHDLYSTLLVGISDQGGSYLMLYAGTLNGLGGVTVVRLNAPARSIQMGFLDGDGLGDAAVLAGERVLLLHGVDASLEDLGLPNARAIALGAFVFDREGRIQIATLSADGSIQIAAHNNFDPRKFTANENQTMRLAVLEGAPNPVVPQPPSIYESWKVIESFGGVSPFSGQVPALLRTRISGNSADDVMVLNPFARQMTLISHGNLADGAPSFLSGDVSARVYSGSPIAAIAMRLNIDGRPGVIALHQGQVAPATMMPLPDPTFTVNTTSDTLNTGATPCASATPGQCSLRQAIFEANATAGNDTIMVPAGTYQLTLTNATTNGENGDLTGDLDITDGVSIVGTVDASGNPTTIVQAGTVGPSGTANGIDKVFSVNPNFNVAFDTSFSNLEIRFGFNHASAGTNGFGGGFDWEADGTGNMTVTNCFIHDNQTTDGEGGGITATNKILAGTGVFTVSNSTVSNNVARRAPAGAAGIGGGIFIGNHTAAHITNTKILNNQIPQANGSGGGIAVIGPSSTGAGQTTIHASTISGNTSAGDGGGIHTGAGILIDQATVISNNTAATNGGGLFNNDGNNETTTLSKVTITGNAANGGHGGGIRVDSNTPNNVAMSFSRLAGNTANTAGSNLSNLAGAVTATNDWWGTNTPAATIEMAGGTTTFDPFIALTHTASPNKIRINQSTTLTASMAADNHGNAAALSGNLDRIIGLPIAFGNAVDGSISGAQTAIQSTGMATATFNAGSVAGGGKADATVDQQTVTANIVVLQPPTISKSFGGTKLVPIGTANTLTFSITNPNVVTIEADFADSLPTVGGTHAGSLVVAATPGVVNGCGGTVTATAGSSTISFSNAALAVSASPCTISVNVQSAVDDVYTNSVTINSTDAGNGNTASDTLTVINPPHVAKVFGASTIPLNGTTTLTITVDSNSNQNLTLSGVAFTDSLPTGLVVATPSGVGGTCTGTVTATAASSSVSLSGQTLAPNTSCTVSLTVQGTTAGVKSNSVQATSTNGGAGNTSTTSLTVVAPPTISKAFNPSTSIPLNGTATLTFTINNPNTTPAGDLTGVAFSDTLPLSGGSGSATLVVASTPAVANTCNGAVTATAGSGAISLSGGTVTHSSSCMISVNVAGTVAGDAVNTTGAITSTEGGTGTTSGPVTLKVVAPPTISKAFGATAIPVNGTTTLTFTITNPSINTTLESGLAFSDTLTGGLQVASTPGVSNTCNGSVTAAASSTSISLSGGSITTPGNTCTISVNVTGTTSGTVSNTTGAVSSTNGGTGATSNSVNLIVASPATVSETFAPTKVPLNGTTLLTINITNPNTGVALNGLSFTDSLPAGLIVAATPNLTNTCNGTATAVAASASLSLSGGTLAANASCAVSVNAQGTTAGDKTNSVTVSSTEGGASTPASATVSVVAPPTISKAFNPSLSIPLNGTATLTFTITNPNNPTTPANGDLTGVAFTDTLPSTTGTLVVASTPNVTNTCNGSVTATAGSGAISLSGGTVTHNTSCTLSVDVKGTAAGAAANTAGAITSTQGGTGVASNTATLKVVTPPTISEAFGAATLVLNGTTTVTFTVTNPATNTTSATGVAFSDTLTGGLQVASTPGVANTCSGSVTAAANSTSISLSGGSITTPGSTCTVTVNVTGTASGTVTNSTGTVSSTNGGTGATSNTATLIVAQAPTVSQLFAASTIPLNGTTSLQLTINNPNTNVAFSGVAFSDTLPAGLVVATPNALSNTCNGTPSATVGSGTISLTGGTLAASSSCTVTVNVTGTSAGAKSNSMSASSTEGGASSSSSGTLTVVAPPTISKAFNPATSIPLNGTSTLTFTISNLNTTAAGDLTGVAFSDTLPSTTGTLLVSSTPGIANTCNGTVTAAANSGVISLTGGAVAHSGSCTISVSVTGTAAGDAANTTGAITSTQGGTGATSNTATLKVVAPPTISKAFGATSVSLNGTTTVTFTITNPATNTTSETGVAFSDTLTGGLQVAATPGVSNTCSGTVTAAANTTSISLSSGSITTPGATCTVTVNVTGTVSGTVSNTTGAVSSTNGGTGATSNTASLTVAAAPSIAKAFGATAIPVNGTTSLTFTITNPNTNVALSGLAFTDNLPAGLVVASTPNLTNTCNGTATATGGAGSATLSGGTLAAGASCTVSLNVTGTTAGVKSNSVQVSSTEGGTGNTSTTSLTVVVPPTISKAFGAASIPLSGTTTLTFTLSNPNTTAAGDLTGVSFSDTLPAATGTLVVASTPGVANTCNGTVTAAANSGVISLSGGTVAHSGSCTIAVNVTGTAAGDAANTTGTISSTQGGTGLTSNSATLKVVAPPTISKAFGATSVSLNGTTTVTFTITNPATNTTSENGIAFSDTLTGGLQVAATPGVSNTCSGTVTAAANSTAISLSGGSITTPGATCTITVNVTGTASGTVTNTTGAVSSTNGGTGATSNTASLTVAAAPTVSSQFSPTSVPINGTSSLTINISNPNSNVALNSIAFTDSLPARLVVAATPNLSNSCGGSPTAVAGSGSISLTGGTLASSTGCSVSVNVTGTTAGAKSNSVQVSSTEGGSSNTSTANLNVIAPPSISKAFGATSIPLNGTTTVTFTVSNPNATAAGDLTGVAFSDTLPSGTGKLVVGATPGVTNTCIGTVTATANGGTISLSGGTVAHSASCTISVNVTGTAAGDAVNTTGAITSTEGGTGTTSNAATLKVVAPPTISKAFGAASVLVNGSTTLTFTITNPATNTTSENGVAFSDTLTGGLQVASTPGVSNTCGGTLTAAANTTSISLSGGSIATPGATCTIGVNVTGTSSGTVTNTTGTVSSTNGGTGATSNTATLAVAQAPTVVKAFGASTIPVNGTTSLTFTITNPNTNVALSGLAFTDSLPAGLVVAATPNLTNTCNGTSSAVGGASSASLSGGTLAASASCTVSLNVQGTTSGVKSNSVQVSSTEGGTSTTSTTSLTVVAPPTISKGFGAASVPLSGTTTLTFTISNPNATAAGDLTGVAFGDSLPSTTGTLLVSATPNVTNSCGGTVTATAGSGLISLSGGSVVHGTSCALSVDVRGAAAGDAVNTTGAIASTQGGTGLTSNTATLKVVAPPAISKAFGAASVSLNGTTALTFVVTNPSTNTTSENGVAFSDTLTGGLQVASTAGVSNTCGGTLTAAANTTSISLSGGSIATPGATCTIAVNVTGTASGTVTNTTGTVSSTNGGTGATSNTATLAVAQAPMVVKTFGAASIPLNGTTSLSFTITNPNTNIALSGLAFTDTLPAGLVIASTPNLSNTCGGTATAVGATGTASLSAGTLAANASCIVSLNVTGTTPGVKSNSVQVSSTEGGASTTSTSAVTVVAPPTIAKAFGAASIPLNGSTSLSFTIQNSNTTTTLTGVGFSDTLPTGLVISTPNGLSGTCGAGVITAAQATNVVSLSGGSIAAGSSCTFSINVKGISTGLENNITGNVTSTEGGTGGTALASVKVEAPPSIAKSFSPSPIALNATTSLTFTITNPAANVDPLSGVAFTDTLPTGLAVASASASVCGGTLTTTSPTGISLSGATISTNGQCQFSVPVTGAASGQYTSTTENVTSTNGGTGNAATTGLTVAAPPTITKLFGGASIPLNTTTSLTFTITNPNTNVALTSVAFTDSLPAGLVVAATPSLTNTCGGTATAVGGASSASLSAGTLPASASCSVSLNVLGTTAGVKNNSVQITSTEAGTGNTSNATVTVVAPPTIAKAFGAASIPLNGTTSLTFTIQNSNTTTTLTGVGFTDTLPAGLAIATPNGLTGSCGGTVTATQATNVVSLSGGSIAANSSCTFSVNVTGTTAGLQNNTTGNVTSTQGGTGGTASATINVIAPPVLALAFMPSTIVPANSTNLVSKLTNPASNTVALTGVGFTDTLPAGLTLASSSATQCGGTLTTTAPGSISLSGATIGVGSVCQFSVTVTVTTDGNFSTTTSAIASANGGAGLPASGSVTGFTPPSFSPVTLQVYLPSPMYGSAQLSAVVSSSRIATGVVTFSEGGNALGTAPVSFGIAALPVPTMSAGVHSITAAYTGDPVNGTALVGPTLVTVIPAPLVITADSFSRIPGAPNPTFTGTIKGILNNDPISASYSTTATAASPAGTYPIVPAAVVSTGGISRPSSAVNAAAQNALSNYSITLVNGSLNVVAVQTGWWWDPGLNGTGFFIETGGTSKNGLFMAGLLYDAGGNATWLVSTGQLNGLLYKGDWLQASGGQTLTGLYSPPTLNSAGSVTVAFSDDSHAIMTRPDGTKINLVRFSFSTNPPLAPVAGTPQVGWWWGDPSAAGFGKQFGSGTGYGIEFQGNAVFIVAYVYDSAGNPIWYLATGSLTTQTTYTGTWDLYAGGPQLTSPEGSYSAHKVSSASPMSLVFSDATHGTLTMGSINIPITRLQSF